jgi:hypothetical protein
MKKYKIYNLYKNTKALEIPDLERDLLKRKSVVKVRGYVTILVCLGNSWQ